MALGNRLANLEDRHPPPAVPPAPPDRPRHCRICGAGPWLHFDRQRLAVLARIADRLSEPWPPPTCESCNQPSGGDGFATYRRLLAAATDAENVTLNPETEWR